MHVGQTCQWYYNSPWWKFWLDLGPPDFGPCSQSKSCLKGGRKAKTLVFLWSGSHHVWWGERHFKPLCVAYSCVMLGGPFWASRHFVLALSHMLSHPAHHMNSLLFHTFPTTENGCLMLCNHSYPLFGDCSFASAVLFDPHKSYLIMGVFSATPV